MKRSMLELTYAPNALAPRMSEQTISFHLGKHLQAYLDNVERLTKGTPFEEMTLKEIVMKAEGPLLNNAAQAWNHIIFFKQLSPQVVKMPTLLTQAIATRFGSVEAFHEAFTQAAISLFGSGWVWLAIDAINQLQLLPMSNAGNPIREGMRPLMCIDVWEHAYYLDYQNRRANYVKEFWYLIDWNKVEHRRQSVDYTLYY